VIPLDGSATLTAPVAVRVIDLDAPIDDLLLQRESTDGTYRSLLAVARLKGVPLAVATFTVGSDGRVSCRRLARGLRRRLQLELRDTYDDPERLSVPDLSEAVPTVADDELSESRRPAVSVVVPTCCNPQALERCLRSILRSDYDDYEVIVVENRPGWADTASMLATQFPTEPRIRYVEEPIPGASRARNAGLARAEGELVAFTDDDVIVDPGWIRASAEALRSGHDIACVAGLILPLELESDSQLLMEQFASFGKGFRRTIYRLPESREDNPLFPYTAGAIGSGASTMMSAEVARELGGFDTVLGPGTPASGGEDLEIFIRVLRAGHAVAYEPSAMVWHKHPDGMPRLRRQVYKYGVGLGAMLAKQLIAGPGRNDFIRALPAGVRYARDPNSRKNAGKPADYPHHLTWFERLGMIVGPAAYVLSALLALLRHIAGTDREPPTRVDRTTARVVLGGGETVNLVWFGKQTAPRWDTSRDSGRTLSRSARTAMLAVAALCVAAPVFVALGLPGYLRMPAVLALLCLGPGVALLTVARARLEPGLVVGISLGATAVVAQSMLWLGAWWPRPFLFLLAAVCGIPLIVALKAARLPLPTAARVRAAVGRGRAPSVQLSTAIHVAMLSVALLAWGISLLETRLVGMGGTGLLGVLPFTYFLAFALTLGGFVAAATSDKIDSRLLGAYVLVLVLILHGTTGFLYDEPRYPWVYKHLGVINLIAATGRVDRQIDVYNNWPAFFAANAWLSKVSGLAPIAYAGFAQLFFNVVNVFAVRFALRGLTRDERLLWTASFIFVLGNWVGQDYLAPQAFAFALSLVILGLCLRCGPPPTRARSRLTEPLARCVARLASELLPRRAPDDEIAGPPLRPRTALLVGGVCFVAVVTSHQLSPVLLILGVAAIALVTQRVPFWIPATMAAVELWWVALAWQFVGSHFTLIQPGSSSGAAAAGRNLSAALPGAAFGFYAPAIVMFLTVALAAAGLLRRLRAGKRDLVPVCLIGAPVLAVGLQSYGGEGPYRAFLFALPWLAFLGALACVRPARSGSRPRMSLQRLTIASAALGVTLLFAYFGQELANRIPSADVQASTWYEQHAPAGSVRVNLAPTAPDRLTARYPLVSLGDPSALVEDARFTGHLLGAADIPRLERLIAQQGPHPTYVQLTLGQENYARLNGLLPAGSVTNLVRALGHSSAFQLVFHLPSAWIFRYVPGGGRSTTYRPA
jgi:GT2 family glycosyltransferase